MRPEVAISHVGQPFTKSYPSGNARFGHVWDMATDTEYVRVVGKTGSVGPTAETALLT